jgi:putative redox protein
MMGVMATVRTWIVGCRAAGGKPPPPTSSMQGRSEHGSTPQWDWPNMTRPYRQQEIPMAYARIVSTADNYLHHISNGSFDVDADEPASLGGQGKGFAPFDLYLASLAACTAITLRMYAQRKGWELGEFHAELRSERDADGRFHVHRVLHATAELSDAQWQRLLEVVEKTPVTLVMREGARISSERGAAA